MSSITHIRPRFKIEVNEEATVVLDKAKAMLKDLPVEIVSKNRGHHIVLDMSEEVVHYWSPQLQFRVEEHRDDPNKSIILGLVGPRPRVWTFFMFVYFSSGTLGLFMSLYGLSKQLLGEETLMVWGFPVAILFMLTAYKAGKIGEGLGKQQVEQLKDFLRELMRSF
jgi:hypothetical protein